MYQKTTLSNGLRIVTSTMPHTFSVSLNLFVGTGSRYESSEKAGISHFIEHMCFKGTHRRPTPREISETVESLGGAINAGTERELTLYWARVAHPHFPIALDLLTDMIRCSRFDAEQIEKERLVILEELKMTNDYPNARLDAIVDEMLWPNHPLGRDIAGTKESVLGITREAMLDYMARQYIPSNGVISIAGDLSHQEVVDRVAPLWEDWPLNTPLGCSAAVDDQISPQFRLEHRKTDQAHLCIALRGLSATHPDRYALDLMSVILGEGMSSRLFLEMRERLGLVYDVYSTPSHLQDSGAFLIYCGVDPKRSHRAIETVLAQIGDLRNGLSKEELHKAKELSKGRLMLRMEDTRAVSRWIGAQEMLLGQMHTVEEVISSVDAVTLEAVQRVASDLLVTEKLNLAIVGPYRSDRRFSHLLKL
ncbi:MAG: insulinase family protein [Chloroflexi bacterium]|nr:insulinase family protein [Chloroflexota bacterium]